MTHVPQSQAPGEPLMIQNPHNGRFINLAPLMAYLHEQENTNLTPASGPANVCFNLKAAYRLIATTPVDSSSVDPGHVASVVADLFTLEDVFSKLTEYKS